MNYFEERTEFDEVELDQPAKRRGKRRWREIEQFKEKRRLSKEIVRDDEKYFDLLDDDPYDYDSSMGSGY